MVVATDPTLRGIQIEYGGTGTLREYVRGGAFPVTNTNISTNASSLTIRQFAGTSRFSISGGSTEVIGSGSRSGAGSKSVTTSSASSGTIAGGSSPYAFLWQYVSGDTFTPNTSTSSSTTFTTSITVGAGGSVTKTGVYRCRVTDNASTVIFGPNCTVQATLEATS